MSSTAFALLAIVIFFGAMIAIGIFNNKRATGSSDNYVLGGRNVPLIFVAGSLFATWVNSGTLMGYGGTGYSVGLAGYWSGGAFMVATMWMGFFLIPRLRRASVTTIPEFFEKYFGMSHRIVTLVLGLGRDLGVTAGISYALGLIFSQLFGLSIDASLIIAVGVVVVYTSIGGMWAVMITDTIQAVLIIVGTTIMIPLGIARAGGLAALSAALPEGHASVLNAGIPQSLGWLLTGLFITVAYQSILQRGLAADSDKTAQQAFLWGGLLSLTWYATPFIIGSIATVLYPEIAPADAFITMAGMYGPYAGVFFLVVLIASCMSTISSSILTVTSNITIDFVKRFISPDLSGPKLVLVQRVTVVIVAIVAVLVGRSLPYILELFWLGGRIMAAGLAPVFLALIFWPLARVAKYATLSAMILGSGVTIYWQTFGARLMAEGGTVFLWSMDPILYGLPVTVIVLIVGVFWETSGKRNKESTA